MLRAVLDLEQWQIQPSWGLNIHKEFLQDQQRFWTIGCDRLLCWFSGEVSSRTHGPVFRLGC